MIIVQREFVNVVEGAGLRQGEGSDDQPQEAISEVIEPPVVVPTVQTIEVNRHGPGEWASILRASY